MQYKTFTTFAIINFDSLDMKTDYQVAWVKVPVRDPAVQGRAHTSDILARR